MDVGVRTGLRASIQSAEIDNNQAAIVDFSEALSLNPMSYPSYLGRAVAYHKLKKYREAIPDLGKANEGIHNNVRLLFRRGLSYFRTYQYDQALVDFKDVTKINPKDAKAFTNAAAALIALDQPPQPLKA